MHGSWVWISKLRVWWNWKQEENYFTYCCMFAFGLCVIKNENLITHQILYGCLHLCGIENCNLITPNKINCWHLPFDFMWETCYLKVAGVLCVIQIEIQAIVDPVVDVSIMHQGLLKLIETASKWNMNMNRLSLYCMEVLFNVTKKSKGNWMKYETKCVNKLKWNWIKYPTRRMLRKEE